MNGEVARNQDMEGDHVRIKFELGAETKSIDSMHCGK